MIFNKHLELVGKHAFLGASKFQHLNWDDETLIARYVGSYAQALGTALHEIAAILIENNISLSEDDHAVVYAMLMERHIPKLAFDMDHIFVNLRAYVNDAIGFRMTIEQPIKYTDRCFGTADAICFRRNILRIHDYKSGVTPAHMEQLENYAAMFCLEYGKDPAKLKFELRIYQSEEVIISNPEPELIRERMDRLIHEDTVIADFEEQEG